MAKRLALIADSPRFLTLLDNHLREAGYDPYLFTSTETAYGRLRDLQPSAIFLAIRQKNPGSDWDLVDNWTLDPLLKGIPMIVSPPDTRHLQERTRQLEGQGCAVLARPFAPTALLALVERLTGAQDARQRRD